MLLSSCSLWAQNSDYDLIRQGNKDYRQKYVRDAETNYQKAANKRGTFEAYYNLGNAMLRQGQDSVAMVNFMKADSLGSVNNKKVAAVRHNMGNDYFAQGASYLKNDNKPMALQFFTKAVNAYKGSLRKNPNDEETRHNLAKAQYWMKKLQEEQQQQQQNQDKNKQEQKKDQDKQNQDKQNQDQKDKDDQKKDQQDKDKKDQQVQDKKDQDENQDKKDQDKDQQNKDQNQQGQDPKNQKGQQPEQGQQRPGQPRQGEIDQETAKKLLDAAQQDEKRIQRRLQEQNKDPMKGYGQRKRKDW